MPDCDANRKYFFLAVNTGFVENGLPDSRCRDFYRARSQHGLHCAIVGNVVVPNGVGSNEVCSQISSDIEWRELSSAIAEQGALAGIQLSTAWNGYEGITEFIPSTKVDPIQAYKNIAASISLKEVASVVDSLNRGTDLAINAGFRHIQLHAAHGYLFNLLIDRRFSPHADYMLKLIQRWANDLTSNGIESSIRISMWVGQKEIDEKFKYGIIDELTELHVSYLDISAGFYNVNKQLIYPSTDELLLARTDAVMFLANRHPNANFILSGKSAYAWDASLPDNLHIGICRDIIANPNFLRDRSGGCTNRMKCHYFSRGQPSLRCGQWASFPGVLD